MTGDPAFMGVQVFTDGRSSTASGCCPSLGRVKCAKCNNLKKHHIWLYCGTSKLVLPLMNCLVVRMSHEKNNLLCENNHKSTCTTQNPLLLWELLPSRSLVQSILLS